MQALWAPPTVAQSEAAGLSTIQVPKPKYADDLL